MFNESRLLDAVSYGSQFGHTFNTRVVSLRNGVERRNANWSMPLGRGSIVYSVLKPEHHQAVIGAHMACMGSAIGFRFKNWTDYLAVNQSLGKATGSEQRIQLVKHYHFGPASLARAIKKPVVGTVQVFADGEPIAAMVDYSTGVVTLTADEYAELTWSGEFDLPVRFESDALDLEPVARAGEGFYLSADVGLVEVRL